jgi:ankyrin repeat protein
MKALQLLIKEGAEIDGRKIRGNTALMVAAEQGKKDFCHELLGSGARII